MAKRRKKKKRLNRKFILFIIIIIIVAAVIYYYKNVKDLGVTLSKDLVININEEVYNTDFIEEVSNGKITSEKDLINTSSIGKKKVTVNIKNSIGITIPYIYVIEIVDNEKPTIDAPSELSTVEGVEINLLSDVSAYDNSGEEIKVTIEGSYDFNTPGTYTLYYVASDSSDNTERKEVTLTVKEEEYTPSYSYNSEHTKPDGEFTTSKGYTAVTKNGITYVEGYLIANKTYALPSTYNPGLDDTTDMKAEEMFAAARNEGLNLYIASGFRSYSTQDALYNRYVSYDGVEGADTYSARPGHSEHQSGLAFDVCDSNLSYAYCIETTFDDTDAARWLSDNAYKYGFILRYPKGKTNETGYIYESWHFRYVGETLAEKLYNNGGWITVEDYFGLTSEYDY